MFFSFRQFFFCSQVFFSVSFAINTSLGFGILSVFLMNSKHSDEKVNYYHYSGREKSCNKQKQTKT